MAADPLEDFSGDPLTARETKKLRKLLHDKELNERLVSIVVLWSGYLAAAAAAFWAAWDHLVKIFKAAASSS